ncbi:MAG: hypothetical protein M1827_005832 [Pycnora praestabilis]|nr:MAG: hypothetical protein M1827_005832 [Pycnora praestabilis]
MASTPPKRRKTSPTTSVPVDASNTSIPGPPAVNTPGRASYLSPTKASLSRHNPSLLPRPKSAAKSVQRPGSREASAPGPEIPRLPRPDGGLGQAGRPIGHRPGLITSGRKDPGHTVPRAATASPKRPIQSIGGRLSAAPRRRSQSPSKPGSASRSALIKNAPVLPFPERGSQLQRNPTAEKIQENVAAQLLQETEDAAETAMQSSQAVTHITESENAEVAEPELPPTPSQRGIADPIVTTPPAGLHNMPRNKIKRNRSHGEILKSSPLKPKDQRPDTTEQGSERRQSYQINAAQAHHDSTLRNGKRRRTTGDVIQKTTEDVSGQRRRLRDGLLAQLEKLQAEVDFLGEEIGNSAELGSERTAVDKGPIELISLLTTPKDYTKLFSQSAPKPPPLTFAISAFLPFSRRPRPKAPDLPPKSPLRSIPSHKPIELNNPLPYLQAFTPLTFNSSISLLPLPKTDKDLYQHHQISIASPQHLLSGRVDMTVNTLTHTVTDLSIPSVSSWAERDLGSWCRMRAKGNDVVGKDIAGICWAMGSYWEMVEKRARCWIRIEKEFSALLGVSTALDDKFLKPSIAKTKERHRKDHDSAVAPDEEEIIDEVSAIDIDENAETDDQVSRADLLAHVGESTLIFKDRGVELMIDWNITFDWTGEAQSDISATTAFPEPWEEADERKSLNRLRETYITLVKERGVLAATKIVVGLVFPS